MKFSLVVVVFVVIAALLLLFWPQNHHLLLDDSSTASLASLPLVIRDFFYNIGSPSLRNSVVGCGANLAGDVMLTQVLDCVTSFYQHFDPAMPTISLSNSVNWMIKRRKYYNLIYVARHYSDLLAFDPILGKYKAVVVVRHPLDRILASVNHYKMSSKESWLLNTSIFVHPLAEMSFQNFIQSLSSSDALLYAIYVASLYFHYEIVELEKLRRTNASGASLEFIKLEDFYNNSDKSMAKFASALNIEPEIVSTCAAPTLKDSLRSGRHIYNGYFDCIHYLYFERVIGESSLSGFGYSDDFVGYSASKAFACKRSKSTIDSRSSTPSTSSSSSLLLSRVPEWPKFNFTVFNRVFAGYEFHLNKISRMTNELNRDKVVTSMLRLDKLKQENHKNLIKLSSKIGVERESKASLAELNPIEMKQILLASNSREKSEICPGTKYVGNIAFDESHTLKYLTFTKQSKEYKSLSSNEKHLRVSDKDFPLDSSDSWVKRFCPEVIKYFNDYDVRYFDFYSLKNEVPLTTTEAAVTMVCMLKAIRLVAEEVNAEWALFAGTQLGAVLHGGPIPWDDDIDVIVDGTSASVFMKRLQEKAFGGRVFRCDREQIFHKTRRCFIDDSAYAVRTGAWGKALYWPFVDIFFYYSGEALTLEYNKIDKFNSNGNHRRLNSKVWRNEDFFPFRQVFYGGIMLPAIRFETAMVHYDVNKCYSSFYNHRIDKKQAEESVELNCCKLSKYFPFIHRYSSEHDPAIVLEVLMIDNRPIHLSRVKLDSGTTEDSFYLHLIRKKTNETDIDDRLTYTKHSN